MTVYKSQSSEYENVLLVLSDHEGPLLTRALIFPGITRAQLCDIWSERGLLRKTVARRISRQSGLADALSDTK